MDLQSFGSLFELFATFALAYIVIDEFTENPFIALVTEKILRKYNKVETILKEIRDKIGSVRYSLNELEQDDVKIKTHEELPDFQKKIKSTHTRFEFSASEIRKQIQSNYATKVFGYLNCYIFFYCLIILFYGGVYSSNTWVNNDSSFGQPFRARLDTSLLIFLCFSVLWVVLGWCFDTNNGENEGKFTVSKIYEGLIFNGYVLAFFLAIFGVALSTGAFFLKYKWVPVDSLKLHNIIIVACIVLPFLNFLIYVIKASMRANKCIPVVMVQAEQFKKDYTSELLPIIDFIGACSHEKSKLKLESENGNGNKPANGKKTQEDIKTKPNGGQPKAGS